MKKTVLFSFFLTAGVAQLFGAAQQEPEAQEEQLAALEIQVAEKSAALKSCSASRDCAAAFEDFGATLMDKSALTMQRDETRATLNRVNQSLIPNNGIRPAPRRHINK